MGTSYAAGGGEPFSWRVVGHEEGTLHVELRGEIDENADFSELRQTLRGDVELGLEGVTRINSCGVREWVNFVRWLDAVTTLWFVRCSPPVVLQLNTIFNFRGRARVRSFLAPYVCEACHADEYKLLDVEEHFGDQRGHSLGEGGSAPVADWHAHVPAFRCRRCGGVLVFDELPERYLSFLAEGELSDPNDKAGDE
jgi:anti-anti-sigma regulatory factor